MTVTQPADDSHTWSEDTFLSQGTECAVRVYRPAGHHQSVPVIVMAHGFGAVRALRLYAYAEQFAAAGDVLARDLGGARLTDHRHLDLTGVLQFLLDTAGGLTILMILYFWNRRNQTV